MVLLRRAARPTAPVSMAMLAAFNMDTELIRSSPTIGLTTIQSSSFN